MPSPTTIRAYEDRGDAARAEPTDNATVSGRRPVRTRLTATDAMRTKLRLDTAYSHTRWSQWRVPPATDAPTMRKTARVSSCPSGFTELVDAGADGALGVAAGQTGDKRSDEAVAPTTSAPAKATSARERTDSRCVDQRRTPSRPARADCRSAATRPGIQALPAPPPRPTAASCSASAIRSTPAGCDPRSSATASFRPPPRTAEPSGSKPTHTYSKERQFRTPPSPDVRSSAVDMESLARPTDNDERLRFGE